MELIWKIPLIIFKIFFIQYFDVFPFKALTGRWKVCYIFGCESQRSTKMTVAYAWRFGEQRQRLKEREEEVEGVRGTGRGVVPLVCQRDSIGPSICRLLFELSFPCFLPKMGVWVAAIYAIFSIHTHTHMPAYVHSSVYKCMCAYILACMCHTTVWNIFLNSLRQTFVSLYDM